MKIVKLLHEYILEIEQSEVDLLVQKHKNQERFTCEEKKVFLIANPEYEAGIYYVLDNRHGCCVIIPFDNMVEVLTYILELECVADELTDRFKG